MHGMRLVITEESAFGENPFTGRMILVRYLYLVAYLLGPTSIYVLSFVLPLFHTSLFLPFLLRPSLSSVRQSSPVHPPI